MKNGPTPVLRRLTFWAVTVVGVATAAAQASGPYIIRPAFWLTYRPAPELETYLAGAPAVLGPRFTRAHLFVAYRHLSAPQPVDLTPWRTYWESTGEPDAWAAMGRWRRARVQVVGEGSAVRIALGTSRERRLDDGTRLYAYFGNCLSDAFDRATATLQARVAVHGAEAPRVRRWVEAQDQVFESCGEISPEPPLVVPEAGAAEVRDRAYQRASAAFYRGEYGVAAGRFAAIAADRDSAWSDLAAYLVGRCHLRRATVASQDPLPAMREAVAAFEAVLGDPGRQDLWEPARRLRRFARLRLAPEEMRASLLTGLMGGVSEEARQDLVDYLWLTRRLELSTVSEDEPSLWLHTVDSAPEDRERAYDLAYGKWAASPSPAWAVAVGLLAEASSPGIKAWLEATEKPSEETSGARWAAPTLLFHRARLLVALNRVADARLVAEAALERFGGELSQGDRNRFHDLRLRGATSLEEALAVGRRRPVGDVWFEDLASGEIASKAPEAAAADEQWLPELNRILDAWIPLEDLAALAVSPAEPTALRGRLAMAGWTRAVLLGREETALELEVALAAAFPDLAEELGHYRDSAPGAARLRTAIFTLLRFPGMTPGVGAGYGRRGEPSSLDSLRDNWWCRELEPPAGAAPAFLSADQREAASAERALLDRTGAAQVYFAERVREWAAAEPDDPRLPEALHRVVRATRFAPCTETEENTRASRGAFNVLHRRFPKSEWAERTPYWFR